MSKTVVIACTSAAFLGTHPTGLWLEEAATPYYLFKNAGYNVILCSPNGGPVPIDQGSITGDFNTEASKKFMNDPDAVGALSHTVTVGSLTFPECCDALYVSSQLFL